MTQLRQIGIDTNRLCTCVIDRYMRSATYEQLKRDSSSQSLPQGMRDQLPQCTAEQGVARGAARTPPMANDVARARAEANRAINDASTEADRAIDEANAEIANAMRQ